MNNLINIYDEEGKKDNDVYEIIKHNTGTKNVIEIKNINTNKKRLIHKDRIFSLSQRSIKMERHQENEKPIKKKAKKKKKPMIKFNLKELEPKGILFKFNNKSTMEVGDKKISVESYYLVSEDATKWKSFQLYDHSLGRKRTSVDFEEKDQIKPFLFGNFGAVEEYLAKKGYIKA